MKPVKLKRNLMTQHPELTGKPRFFSKEKIIFEAEKSFYEIFGVKRNINESILFSGAKSGLSKEILHKCRKFNSSS